jgi:phenylpyruvate tautomerase PptA (4-oxalocrotonate tautomerase family)
MPCATLDSSRQIDEVVQAAAKTVSELLAEYVVDVPATTEQLIDQARADNWAPAAAGLAISRPAWWTGQPDPVDQLVRLLYPAIREGDREQLPGWQQAAMLGAVRLVATPAEQCQNLANLALLGWESESAFVDLADRCRTARRIAATFNGVDDPVQALPAARVVLGNEGFVRSEQLVEELRAELGEWDAG